MKNNTESDSINTEPNKIICYKKKLRKKIQNRRDCISPEDRKKKSKIIAEKFYNTAYYLSSGSILIYYPFKSEIDTTIIIRQALADNKNIILPRVEDNELKLFYVDSLPIQLEKGNYDIMEPIPNLCRMAKISEIELAVVPGVGFDKNLNRLGYGSGFYDKLLSLIPETAKKIALCFDIQIVNNIPVLEHDIKIDLLITESKTYHS